jgi:hypothetical protein
MNRFTAISERAAKIGAKAEAGQATHRDLAELAELYQQTMDGIDELMDEPYKEPALIARIDGQSAVKFSDAEAMAKWITGVIHG